MEIGVQSLSQDQKMLKPGMWVAGGEHSGRKAACHIFAVCSSLFINPRRGMVLSDGHVQRSEVKR